MAGRRADRLAQIAVRDLIAHHVEQGGDGIECLIETDGPHVAKVEAHPQVRRQICTAKARIRAIDHPGTAVYTSETEALPRQRQRVFAGSAAEFENRTRARRVLTEEPRDELSLVVITLVLIEEVVICGIEFERAHARISRSACAERWISAFERPNPDGR